MTGYLKAQRDRFDHHLFRSEKFCRGYAWDWMCAKACYRPQRYTIKGKTIEVQRGQFVASPDEMAKVFKWSRSAVNRFLARLQSEHMIEHDTGHKKSLITICKYEEYQSTEGNGGHKTEHQSEQKADTKRTAKEGREEGKKRDKSLSVHQPSSDRFDEFWEVYPHRGGSKKGKAPTRAKYLAAVKRGVPEQTIIDGAIRSATDRQVVQGFARNPETWINQVGWEDEIEAPQLKAITGGRQDDRRQFAEAHREYTRRLASGAIDPGPDASDPFAR